MTSVPVSSRYSAIGGRNSPWKMDRFLAELAADEVLFVLPPPSVVEVDCPVCYCLLVDAHLTDCCGRHFCGKCLEKITTRLENLICSCEIIGQFTKLLLSVAGSSVCVW